MSEVNVVKACPWLQRRGRMLRASLLVAGAEEKHLAHARGGLRGYKLSEIPACAPRGDIVY